MIYINFPRINDSFNSDSKIPHKVKPVSFGEEIWTTLFGLAKNGKVFMTSSLESMILSFLIQNFPTK